MRSRSYSARPISTAAAHDTVPARPTRVRASATPDTSRSTSSRWASVTDRQATSSSGRAGSCSIHCSVRRTHPMSHDRAPSASVVPTTNSVEPPPMSTTRNGPSLGSRSAVAPAKARCASAMPDNNSGRNPTMASAASKNSSRLPASRAAEVAVIRHWVTPWTSMASRYSTRTASTLSMASDASRPVASTLSPIRVMCIRRSRVSNPDEPVPTGD